MSEPMKSYNMVLTALRDVRDGKPGAKKALGRTLAAYALSAAATAAAAGLIDALRDDDEDKEFDEKYLDALAEPVFDIGIPQAMGAVAAREYAKQAETARDAAILAGETAKEELNGIVASADDALDQKIAETGTLLDEKVATAAQRASEAASSAVAAAQKATAAEQAMQGAQAAQAQAEQSAQEAADSAASINPSVYMQKSVYDPGNEQQPLLPRNGDGSNVTASFTEAEQDADIASGEKLSVLFGKIKKRFSVVNKLVNGAVYPNLGTNTNFPDAINQRGKTTYTGDNTSPYCIDRWRISNGTTYTVGTFTLSAATYANRACGMWQSNEMGAHQLSIGDDITVSIYANGKLHTPTMKVIDRDLYDAFANVPAGYDCDDFEIVLCTYARDNTMYNLGIYPKKPLTVNYIKWEKGSVATPYVPKGYGAELSECLRYYYQVASVRTFGQQHTGAGTYVNIILPQVMRVTPTVSAPGEWTIRFNGMDKKATVSSVNSLTGNTLNLTMSTIAGGTYIGPLYAFYDGKITFSADL